MLSMILNGQFDIFRVIVYIISSLVVVFLTLPIHEYAHARAAVKLGDPTPRYQGRLTLNPFAHIDYMGALAIMLFGFGWAKPVQINARNFNNPKRDMAITAVAGPLSNVIVAFVALLVLNFLSAIISAPTEFLMYIKYFFFYIANINIYLAVFNLVPIPPLDGSRLLSALLPDRYYYKLMQYERMLFLVVLVLCFTGALGGPLSYLSNLLFTGINSLASLPFMFFG